MISIHPKSCLRGEIHWQDEAGKQIIRKKGSCYSQESKKRVQETHSQESLLEEKEEQKDRKNAKRLP